MARPTKYSEDLAEKICNLLEGGNTRKTAYTVAGISHDTFAAWLLKFSAFSERVKRAEQVAIARNVVVIQAAATKQWQAAAWFLERKDPDNWKQRQGLDIDLTKLSDEELEQLERIRDKAAVEGPARR